MSHLPGALLDIDKLKKGLQDYFTDGLVTVVGSGLSVAEGIPGMSALAAHLLAEMPKHLNQKVSKEWRPIAQKLEAGEDLESALLRVAPSPNLQSPIAELTARLILDAELRTIAEVVSGQRTLRFTRLLRHVLKPNTGVPVITTNYDRLLEIAGECAGLGVDTLFVGHHLGRLSAKESSFAFCRGHRPHGRGRIRFIFRERLTVLKPHGSIDWFMLNGQPVRCPYQLPLPRLIITPGLNKYRTGYDRPFDAHRERANHEIDYASRYLIIGYGFNDNHLETHLTAQLKAGKPALVLSRTLSDAAQQIVGDCCRITAIAADPDPSKPGAWIISGGGREFLPDANVWDLGVFVEEVLQP